MGGGSNIPEPIGRSCLPFVVQDLRCRRAGPAGGARDECASQTRLYHLRPIREEEQDKNVQYICYTG